MSKVYNISYKMKLYFVFFLRLYHQLLMDSYHAYSFGFPHCHRGNPMTMAIPKSKPCHQITLKHNKGPTLCQILRCHTNWHHTNEHHRLLIWPCHLSIDIQYSINILILIEWYFVGLIFTCNDENMAIWCPPQLPMICLKYSWVPL